MKLALDEEGFLHSASLCIVSGRLFASGLSLVMAHWIARDGVGGIKNTLTPVLVSDKTVVWSPENED